MEYIQRKIEHSVQRALAREKSVLLLGPRQTGKTTLIERLPTDWTISLIRPEVRQRYEKTPGVFAGEVEALPRQDPASLPTVVVDEVQKVPLLLDVVQDLIDRRVAKFVLTGSSARKLRRSPSVNLLPGRVVSLRLDPLTLDEHPPDRLEDALLDGALPAIQGVAEERDRELDLQSYVVTYLEEEVRAEALVRDVGLFGRFLELAGTESGNVLNFSKLSRDVGVAYHTIASYYEILEDCLVGERIEPVTESRSRKRLTKTPKFLVFDLGVRRVAAKEGRRLPREKLGNLLEQFVGLELLRCARLASEPTRVRFWRDPNGPEVDWVLETTEARVPVEVKWTDTPTADAARHVGLFLTEYPGDQNGYVVCRSPRRVKLADRVYAIPWQELDSLLPVGS